MESSNVLTAVCVLTIVVGHVAGQFSTNATMCFEKLDPIFGEMTSDDKGSKPPVLDNLCSKTVEVAQCYQKLIECPETAKCPRYRQVYSALASVCTNMDGRRSCIRLSQLTSCTLHLEKDFSPAQGQHRYKAYRLDRFTHCINASLQTCDDKDFVSETTNASHPTGNLMKPGFTDLLSGIGSALGSLDRVSKTALDGLDNAFDGLDKAFDDLDKASKTAWDGLDEADSNRIDRFSDAAYSGCLKLAPWSFLGVISALISSGFKRV